MSSIGHAHLLIKQNGVVPPVSCAYPLNDDGTIAGMFGMTFAPATAPSYQSITYTYTGTATGGTAITTPANPFASPGLFTVTDKTGIGFRYNTPVVASSSPIYFQVVEWQPGLGSIFRFAIDGDTGNVRCESGSGGLTVDFALSGVDVANAKFALSINANTNTVDYIVDGLNIGTASATFTTPDFFIVTSIYDTSPISPVGQTITMSVVSDEINLANYGFPTGTVTVCGTPIPAFVYPLDDDGTLASMFGVGHLATIPPIYNAFNYTYLSPAGPPDNLFGIPSVARFFGSAQIPLNANRSVEAVITTPPTGDIQQAALYAIFMNGMTPTGTGYIGIRDVSGIKTYTTSNGQLARTVNSNIHIGLSIDFATGDMYCITPEGTKTIDAGAAIGATHVVWGFLIVDDGTTPASDVIIGSVLPKAGDMTHLFPPNTFDFNGDPCPVDPNWGGIPPVVLSAYTDSLYGTEVYVQYDQPIMGSPSLGYTINVNSIPITFSTATQTAPDTLKFADLSVFIQNGDTVTLDYAVPPGDTASDPGGVPVVAFTNQAVTNNVPANPTCNYPFTIGNTEIVMSNFNMTGSYTLEAGSKFYLKQPYGYPLSPYQFNVTAGISVLELGFDSFQRPAGGLSAVKARYQFKDTTGAMIGRVELEAQNTGYTLSLAMTGFGSSSVVLGEALPQRVGISFDNNTATVNVYTENTLRLTSSYNNGLGDAVMELGYQTTSIGGTDVGQTYSYTVYTLASDFLQTCYDPDYLVAYDNCLNAVNAGAQYALTDTGMTTTFLGFANAPSNGSPFPSQQNVTYTTTGSTTGGFAVSIPNFVFSPIYPTLAPIRYYAVGMQINALPTISGSENAVVGLTAAQYTLNSQSRTYFLGAGRDFTGDYAVGKWGTAIIYNSGFFATDFSSNFATLIGKKVGILIDTSTGQVAYYVDGERIAISGQPASTGSSNWYFALAFADQATGDFAPTPSGQGYDVTFLSRAEDLEGMGFPPMTRDIQGNLVLSVPATYNPTDKQALITLTNSDYTAENTTTGYTGIRTTQGVSSGKWYWETKIDTGTRVIMGIGTSAVDLNLTPYLDAGFYGYESDTGDIYEATTLAATVATSTTGDTIGMALDMDAGTLDIMLGGVSVHQVTGLTGTMYPLNAMYQAQTTINTGRDSVNYPMVYDPLYGYQKGLYSR